MAKKILGEKAIFNRLNEAYGDIFGDSAFDEWYGNDDYHVWRFYRPEIASGRYGKTHVRLVADDYGTVKVYTLPDTEYIGGEWTLLTTWTK